MKAILLFTVATLACLASTSARDMIVGINAEAARLHYSKEVHLTAVPNMTLETEKDFSFPAGGLIIKGINCYDVDNGEASATITSGGVDYSNVKIRFVSEEGKGLNYICAIYG